MFLSHTALKSAVFIAAAACAFSAFADEGPRYNPEAKIFKYSTTIEKERPQLSEETRRLIAAYRRNPSAENLAALRRQVGENYDRVLAKKRAKLEELRRTARRQEQVTQMQEIVDEMVRGREEAIDRTIARFTDTRMNPGARRSDSGYLPVLGAGRNVFVAYAPVTVADYDRYMAAKGKKVPAERGRSEQGDFPVTGVSYYDAVDYCRWLTEEDKTGAVYRLPTSFEWEMAAGHMPKDADFNNGLGQGLMSVHAFKGTLSASGAIDMWGNAREWTSTPAGDGFAVKGCAWNDSRMSCRTEDRTRHASAGTASEVIGFRVVKEEVRQPARRRN